MISTNRTPLFWCGLIVLVISSGASALIGDRTFHSNQWKKSAAFSPLPVPAPQGSGYAYRRSVTIDHTKVPNTDQSNFPVLISGTYAYLATTGNGGNVQNANGYDVIFTSDSGCATKLDHEVETYSASTGAVNYWVRVPAVSHSSDSVIYMCYGNSGISTSQENRASVWDANFKSIYHLKDGSTLNGADSTNNHNLTNNGASAATGQVGGGGAFNGSTQYLSSAEHADFDWANLRTVECWMKLGNTSQTLPRLFSQSDGSSSAWSLTWLDPGSGAGGGLNGSFLVVSVGTQSTPLLQKRTPDGGISSTSSWYHIAVVSDGNNVAAVYVNGSPVTLLDWGGNITNTTVSGLNVGRRNNDARYLNGSLDEIRFSNAQRSADWIRTEYNNQSSPSTFYTISANASGGSTNGYTYQRSITIDHTKVPNTDQSNFPVLISGTYAYLATTGNGGNVQNANGYDVIFTSDSGCATKLDHEVETYSASTGAVNYWVRVPAVSHSSDSVIYMCYGNSGISTSQENRASVWDANFKSIYHLKDGSTLNGADSTNNHNLTNNGASAATGQVGGGGAFNGSTQYLSSAEHADFDWANLRTVECWMKLGNTSQTLPRLFSQSDGSSSAWSLTWLDPGSGAGGGLNGSFLVVSVGTQSTPLLQKRTPDGGISSTSSWYHIAVVSDGNNVAAVYVNGSPVTLLDWGGNITNTTVSGLNV